jgi:uncharacterized membrane protein HdeD (DUF308 family)
VNQQDKIFKPQNARAALIILILPVLFFACVFTTYTKAEHFRWDIEGGLLIIAGCLGIISTILFRIVPKEIRFENKIVVKRYIYNDLIIDYSDIIHVDFIYIILKNGLITLFFMKNSRELLQIIGQLIEDGKIIIPHSLKKREDQEFKVFVYSTIPAFIIYSLLYNIFNEDISKIYLSLLLFIVWMISYKLIRKAFSKNEE